MKKTKSSASRPFILIMAALLIVIIAVLLITGAVSGRGGAKGNPVVEIEMEDGGRMVFELYPEYAPKTVRNFVKLVEDGFYDGTIFHRIIKGFMIQGGAPKSGDVRVKTIKGEFAENGFKKNTLKHTRGVISMARTNDPDSASTQFFIVHGDTAPHLDGKYAAFGKLIEGEETLDKIAETPVSVNPYTSEVSLPTLEVRIKKAYIKTD